jgi:hypothetical protein
MNPPQHNLIHNIIATLDQLIECQKLQQEAILERHPQNLEQLSAQIDQLAQQLHQQQVQLKAMTPASLEDMPEAKLYQHKFNFLQNLALQNHLLLENGLDFLQQMFAQLLGIRTEPPVYNSMGMTTSALGSTGGFLEVKV